MSIKVKKSGSFKNIETYLLKHQESMFSKEQILEISEKALQLFKDNTPSKTGKTKESWSYEILLINGKYVIDMCNSNIQNGFKIAILVDEGHATQNGHWVAGKHYIDKTIKEIFEYINSIKE